MSYNWSDVNCRTDCGRCNHKGVRSNRKGSVGCLKARKEYRINPKIKKRKNGLFSRLFRRFH